MGVLPHVETLGTDRDQLDRLSAQSWAVTSGRGLEVLHFAPAAETLEHKSLAKGVSFQRRLDDLGITDGPARDDWEQMLVTTEGAHRRALRRPFAVLLAGPQVKKLTGEVRRIVEGILDEIPEGREIDVMGDIAWKVPSGSIATWSPLPGSGAYGREPVGPHARPGPYRRPLAASGQHRRLQYDTRFRSRTSGRAPARRSGRRLCVDYDPSADRGPPNRGRTDLRRDRSAAGQR